MNVKKIYDNLTNLPNNTVEEWRDCVAGYGYRYMVSTCSRVYDKKNGALVSQVLTGVPSYFYVNLQHESKGRKLVRVHRVSAMVFTPNDNNHKFVDHEDRNRYNNNTFNFRWVDKRSNTNNRDCTRFVEYLGSNLPLTEAIEKAGLYEDNNTSGVLVSRFHQALDNGWSFEDAVDKYKQDGNFTVDTHKVKITISGVDHLLFDWCKDNGLDYGLSFTRLNYGWAWWNILYNYPPTPAKEDWLEVRLRYDNLHKTETGVGMVFPTKTSLCKWFGLSTTTLYERVKKESVVALEDAIYFNPTPIYTVTYNGELVTNTLSELCKLFGISQSAVNSRVGKDKWSLQKALETPLSRIRRYEIDGIIKPRFEWVKYFLGDDMNTQVFGTMQSKNKLTFEQTLNRYGVDTSNMTILPC